ncbi:alpha/beta hydrolase [Nonomuraea wenchangensis]|uniref:alpha/beta hydrolase n=1 Tax=Nonomuraea wenchangensis TaxID=568860 RepID=UPI0037AFF2D8
MSRAYDPDLLPYVETIPSVELSEFIKRDAPPFDPATMDPAVIEKMAKLLPQYTSERPVTVEDRVIPGDVRVRLYRPEGDTPLPALIYLHGGGFVSGELDFFQVRNLRFADRIPAVVIAVDYSLAPEHPFPAALEDCMATLEWVHGAAGELGVDPGRIAAGGDSAGGNLSTALAMLTRDRGGPPLCFQLLDVPVTDDRLETPSMRDFVDTPMWNRGDAILSWRYYLPDADGPVSPYAAPARAEDLSGLPPAYVSVCEFDPLRDEGIAYAQRLVQAGVHTELHMYPGAFHGAAVIADTALTRRMNEDMIEALRRALHSL